MWDLVKLVAVFASLRYFIIEPLNLNGQISGPAQVTAIVCGVIFMTTVVLSIYIGKRK